VLQEGDVDDALARFRTLVELRPSLAIAHANLTQALQTKGRLDDAITEFRLALQLAPKQSQAHQALGRALSLQNKTDDAIAEFKQAVLLAPQQPDKIHVAASKHPTQGWFVGKREVIRFLPVCAFTRLDHGWLRIGEILALR
jgi:tetratricopeptide (TPR) repeat protein